MQTCSLTSASWWTWACSPSWGAAQQQFSKALATSTAFTDLPLIGKLVDAICSSPPAWKLILTTVARRYWDEEHDIWVMDLPAIRVRYLRSWAAVDAMAAMPWDVIAVVAQDSWIGRLQVRLWRKCLHRVYNWKCHPTQHASACRRQVSASFPKVLHLACCMLHLQFRT